MADPKPRKPESVHDVVESRYQPIDVFFQPRTVAVIGASEVVGSIGRMIVRNLIESPFGGTVFPVNPKRASVMGIKSYGMVRDVPDQVDLAIIATPAPTVPGIVTECIEAKARGAIIVSSGFQEAGPAGQELERRVMELARGKMRVLGPNCLGLMTPATGLNASLAGSMARGGSVAFLSQSGALCTAVLDWSERELVGFSAFVSVGSMCDVGWGDLIQYLGDDPRTRSIVIYMESIGDARSFLSAAREVALSKPIIVIKGGRTPAASKAAASHTGTLVGSDDVLEAAFRRCGVLRVSSIADLFYMAEVLAKQPRPAGPKLAIVTNAGGPGVLATDALVGLGGEMAELCPATIQALDKLLPANWSHGNPVDVLGEADPERFSKAVEIVSKDPSADGLLVILTPQAMTDPTQTAEKLKPFSRLHGPMGGRPILASWMGGPGVAAGESILNQANIPTFPYPDTAARVFHYMWRYSYNLKGLYETPTLTDENGDGPDAEMAAAVIGLAHGRGSTLLTEASAKRVLEAYGIPTVRTEIALTEEEAVGAAARIGYPVVLKVHSETTTHKAKVGGVQLNLTREGAVREAWKAIEQSVRQKAGAEHFLGVTVQPMADPCDGSAFEVIVGSTIDPQFGPVLLFGSGGQSVHVYDDHSLALPPLTTTLARRMMEQTRIFAAMQRDFGCDAPVLNELERALVRFSRLVVEQPRIREIDINPLQVSPERVLALDARMVLHPPEVIDPLLPRSAIRPYPSQYAGEWVMKNGTRAMIRPIRPEDEPLMVRFHEGVSQRSVYLRYFHMMNLDQRVSHERLTRICFNDYNREIALVVEVRPEGAEPEILGVGRLVKGRAPGADAEFAILIRDAYQRQGMGIELLRRLVEVGRKEKAGRIVADILDENTGMQEISRRLGFQLRHQLGEGVVRAELPL